MRTTRNLAIAVALTLLLSAAAYAGTIDPDGTYTPDAKTEASAMYTLDQLYDKVVKGTDPTVRTGDFAQPSKAPASTMHTLVDINGKIVAGTTTAVDGDVLATKTFITRTTNGEAMATGNIVTQTLSSESNTVAAGYYVATTLSTVDTRLTGSNIKKDVYIFNVEGTYEGSGGTAMLPKTTQTSISIPTNGHPAVLPYDLGDDQAVSAGYPGNGVAETIARWTKVAYLGQEIMVTDKATNLTWMRRGDMPIASNMNETGGSVTSAGNWTAAFTYVATLNAALYGGCNDWRVPNIKELQSIVNYQVWAPAVYRDLLGYFTGSVSNVYWSSTTVADDTTNAWGVDYIDGVVYYGGKTDAYYVRPVRGG